MIRAVFYKSKEIYSGFEISGHAGYAEKGSDIVCASVSSAVQFAINLLAEFGCKPLAEAQDNGTVRCEAGLCEENASRIINQLMLHLKSILEEFPQTIKITISEV